MSPRSLLASKTGPHSRSDRRSFDFVVFAMASSGFGALFLPTRPWVFALQVISKPMHQLPPACIANCIKFRSGLPSAVREPDHARCVFMRNAPGQHGARPLGIVAMTAPNHVFSRIQFFDLHPEDR